MEEMLTRVWEQLIGRIGGPLTLRFVLQPTVAAFLAIRAGLRDAREGRAPFLWTVLTDPSQRQYLLREGWKDVGKVFVFALVLDVTYTLAVFRWIYPGQTLMVAAALAIFPYVLIRGPVMRIARPKRLRPQQE